jgi:hypothetical protein
MWVIARIIGGLLPGNNDSMGGLNMDMICLEDKQVRVYDIKVQVE